MKRVAALTCAFVLAYILAEVTPVQATPPGHGAGKLVSPEQAQGMLEQGNDRYVRGRQIHPNRDARRRKAIAQAQHPFAIILGCADSRVAPEVLFDRGQGDLFVVRNAGNVVDDVVLASIEYAAEHLGSTLVVVLGHERCGAVTAAASGGEAPGHLPACFGAIQPSVEKARGMEGELVENVMRLNVQEMVGQIRDSEPVLRHRVQEGRLKVVGARYDLDTGEVRFLP